ncbi:hypothetical protein G7054_g11125 [Neopestalotiopsis clavispora]|nr:hypothetical protein G7054_g11125 [Neopestalotiopsis clavispora]
MDSTASKHVPHGIFSLLDTDLYKLTMQCAILKFYPGVNVSYTFINRALEQKFSRKAFHWFREQVFKLGNLAFTPEELEYLGSHCKFLSREYLDFLRDFRLFPSRHVQLRFVPIDADAGDECLGDMRIDIRGKWVDTILYEVPLLALLSEAYFKFIDTDWSHDGQEEKALEKGVELLEAGCATSEFGTRRRRDYHTQALVLSGLLAAQAQCQDAAGQIVGTSNVQLAMRFGLTPVGTIAHEWFMGTAAITGDYLGANTEALQRWVSCYGEGVLGIALTDTFGTAAFLEAFGEPLDQHSGSLEGQSGPARRTFAQVFDGVRQDSGDPREWVWRMRQFYDSQGIYEKKTVVFSDSLDVEKCIEYRSVAMEAGFRPVFGIGTFLTNDFIGLKTGNRSVPLNIVIKLSSASGSPAVKISDTVGKTTGDRAKIAEVIELLSCGGH